MSDAALIDEWLDGTIDDAGQAELERRLDDTTVAAQLVRTAHFRRTLRRLAARMPSQAATVSRPVPRGRSRPSIRRRPVVWLAVAACLCAAVGLWLGVAQWSAAADRPALAGTTLADGQVVSAADTPVTLDWRDGTHAELVAGGSLRVETGPGKHLALLHGTLRATVAKQSQRAPMRISGRECEAIVMGTILEFSQAPAASRLAVSQGAVRLVRDRDGFETTVSDGGSCIVPFDGRPSINRTDISTTALDDDEVSAERSARCGDPDTCQLMTEAGVSGATAYRVTGTLGSAPVREVGSSASSWILLTSAPWRGLWNLESSDGIEFWYRGPGTGGRVWIELICQAQPGATVGSHFVSYAPDTVPGWRLIRLPWSAFAARAGQTSGISLHTDRIMMVNIAQLCEPRPDFAVDRIAAWTARAAAGGAGTGR